MAVGKIVLKNVGGYQPPPGSPSPRMIVPIENRKGSYVQAGDKAEAIKALCEIAHDANRKWWYDLKTGKKRIKRNVGELLMLTVSELAEAMEGHRKDLPDDKLPHRKMFEVELADAIIRIFDIAGGMKLDLGGAFVEKMAYNATRKDHTKFHRLSKYGKKY